MNVLFHTIGGLATAAALYSRPRRLGVAVGIGVAVGVALHGVLDCAWHSYPLRPSVDVALSLVVAVSAVLAARGRGRVLVAGCFAGCVLPDVIDLGPQQLNRKLGTTLPVVRFFPWHWPEYSGSVYDGSHTVASLTGHVIVVAVSLGVLGYFGRRLWVQPSARSDTRPSR